MSELIIVWALTINQEHALFLYKLYIRLQTNDIEFEKVQNKTLKRLRL